MTFTLHDYQRDMVAWLHEHERGGLFLDMGLGKTAIQLSALTEEHLPALVIAPKRVANHVWAKEQGIWRPDLNTSVAANRGSMSKKRRLELMRADTAITVMTRDVTADLAEFKSKRWKTLILDESSSFKSRTTNRWKNVAKWMRAKDAPDQIWLGTGTPSPNGLIDLWAQLWLLDFGARLEPTLTGYRERYFKAGQVLPTGVISKYVPRDQDCVDAIHAAVADITVSMQSIDYLPDLPEQMTNKVSVDMPPMIEQVYKTMHEKAVVKINGETFSASTGGALANRLTQITAGFLYRKPDDGATLEEVLRRENLKEKESIGLHKSKVEAVEEIVEGTSGGVLVFYRYKHEKAALLQAFPQARTIEQFDQDAWDRGDIPILIAHPASAGHGLNLQHGGHTIIWTSLPQSLEEWQQANKRLLRQGQTHTVMLHILVVPETGDEIIETALANKEDVQQALLDYVSANPVAVRSRRATRLMADLI